MLSVKQGGIEYRFFFLSLWYDSTSFVIVWNYQSLFNVFQIIPLWENLLFFFFLVGVFSHFFKCKFWKYLMQ